MNGKKKIKLKKSLRVSGVAVTILAMSYICSIYANVYVSHALYYMFAAMKQPYGWAQLENTTTYKWVATINFLLWRSMERLQLPSMEFRRYFFLHLFPDLFGIYFSSVIRLNCSYATQNKWKKKQTSELCEHTAPRYHLCGTRVYLNCEITDIYVIAMRAHCYPLHNTLRIFWIWFGTLFTYNSHNYLSLQIPLSVLLWIVVPWNHNMNEHYKTNIYMQEKMKVTELVIVCGTCCMK